VKVRFRKSIEASFRSRIHRVLFIDSLIDKDFRFEDRILSEPTNKMTTTAFRKNHKVYMYKQYKFDSPSLGLIDENLATGHNSICLNLNKPWNKVLNEKIDQMISAGIAQRIEDKVETRKEEDPPPHPLTMDHIGVCFIVIGIFWTLSIVVFAVEWMTKLVGDSIRQRFG
jgi:hypothetical protein